TVTASNAFLSSIDLPFPQVRIPLTGDVLPPGWRAGTRHRTRLNEPGGDDPDENATRYEQPSRGVVLCAAADHNQGGEDLRTERGHGVGDSVDEAHRLSVDLRGEYLGRNREEGTPGHVREETHAAERRSENHGI